MTRTEKASLVRRRARADATVLLTSRGDLLPMDFPPDTGIDLLVSIVKEKAIPPASSA